MRPLNGYPDSFGAKRASVFPHRGPVLYAALTTTPVAGGDTVFPVEAGLQEFDAVVCLGFSDSGDYWVQGVTPAANPSGNPAVPQSPPTGATARSWKLRWNVTATGAEAAAIDLSAEVVRLFAIGPR